MHKSKSREFKQDLSRAKAFWNECVMDVAEKLKEARKRVHDLEYAKRVFEKNAEKGAPIPGNQKPESVAVGDLAHNT